jgi:pyridoxal phosphate enzyme (YggS family)
MDHFFDEIAEAVNQLLEEIPSGVTVVAAAKGRTNSEVEAALRAGITHVGHNYVQEARPMVEVLGGRATWHMIGHLQRNKVARAVLDFDMIESVDSVRLAKEIERRCALLGKTMPVLIEINSGRESTKTGVFPEQVDELLDAVSEMSHLRVMGLMTMGPRFGDPEASRPYFVTTREIYMRLSSADRPNVTMRYLSMGMTNSYRVAIEEGANIVRIGTKIFGERPEKG